MKLIHPYLNFPGNTEEAFNFYKSVFGGEFVTVQRFKDTPEADRASAEDGEKLMHIALALPNGNILMGTDALESMGHPLTMGNNINLSIDASGKEEADELFNGLSDGAHITVPITTMFWGAYFGMLTDKFGVQWMVNYDGK